MNGPLNANLRINATAIATAPVQRPIMNDNLMERCLIMQSLIYLSQLSFFQVLVQYIFYVVAKKDVNYKYIIGL